MWLLVLHNRKYQTYLNVFTALKKCWWTCRQFSSRNCCKDTSSNTL